MRKLVLPIDVLANNLMGIGKGKTDYLLSLIREGKQMTLGQQLRLTAYLSVPAIMLRYLLSPCSTSMPRWWAASVRMPLLPSDWSRPQLGCSGGCVQPLRRDFPCRWHIVSEPGISWKPKRYSVKQLLPRLFSVRCWLLAVFVSAVCFLSGWVETRRYGTIRPSTSEYSHYSCLPCS